MCLLHLAARPLGSLNPAGVPLIEAEKLSRQAQPPLTQAPPLSSHLEALRENPEGLEVDQLAAIVAEQEGFNAGDPKMAATIRQRCMMAMYRYLDKGQVVKERRGTVRVWRLHAAQELTCKNNASNRL